MRVTAGRARLGEEELRLFIERVPAAVAMLDRDLRYLLISDRWIEDFGFVGRDLTGLHHYDAFPDIPERWKDVHRRALAGEAARDDDDVFERADGTAVHLRWEILPWHERSGAIGGIVIFAEDITERKRAEALAAGQREVLELIATGAPLTFTLETIMRVVESQAEGLLCSVLLLDESRRHLRHGAAPSLARAYVEAIDGAEIGPSVGSCGTAAFRGEPVIVTDIGVSPLWDDYRELAFAHGLRACWSTPIRSTAGEVLGTFAMYYREPRQPEPRHLELVENATHLAGIAIERVSSLEKLMRSELRYRQLVELSPDLVGMHAGGRVTFVNTAGARMLGARTGDDLVGKPVLDLVHPDDRETVRERMRVVSENRMPVPFAGLRFLRLDGSPLDVEVAAVPITLDGKPGTQFVARDVSELRQLESRMQETQKLESLGLLAGGIAHDFNNLLVAILGNAELALLDVPPGTARDLVDRVAGAAHRAADLTRELLAYAGRARLEPAHVDLSALVAEMATLLDVSVAQRARLRRELADGLPMIEGDPTQLRQVVMNLITNASEALGDEGGSIVVRTGSDEADERTLAEAHGFADLLPGRYLFLEVEDDGCGMDGETRARMFDPFFTTKFAGRGLGLAAVVGIVRAHAGAVIVHSEPAVGTRFRILLPPSARARNGPAPAGDVGFASGGSGTVLIADDDEGVRSVGRASLERAGFTVVEAIDGLEAIALLARREDVDLVVLDQTMPGPKGDEVLRRLRAVRPGVRVLLSSGYAEEDAGGQGSGEQFDGFLQKPYRPAVLVDRARRLVSR